MDDTLQNLALALFTVGLIHGSLVPRARHNANRQMREVFGSEGTLRTQVTPRGALGLLASDVWAIDVYGDHLRADRLPFYRVPKTGWKGSIRHLRLHLTDFTLKGLPVLRFDSDIPFATFDIGQAIWRDRLLIRDSGVGEGTVQVGAQGLRLFVLRKYERILSDVEVLARPERITLTGTARFLGLASRLRASGTLMPRAGRYVDLAAPEIYLNGELLAASAAQAVLAQINPILDIETDLGLRGFFVITGVTLEEGTLTMRGRMTVPTEAEAAIAAPKPMPRSKPGLL